MRHLQERKAKKEGKELPRRNPLDVSDFDPSQYALRIWREERKNHQELCAETRRTTTDIGMKPVDQPTRLACTAFVCKINITRRRSVKRIPLPHCHYQRAADALTTASTLPLPNPNLQKFNQLSGPWTTYSPNFG